MRNVNAERRSIDAVAKPVCGARTRRGTPCMCKNLLRGGRCRFHGGMSTGPRTTEGKARSAANLTRRLRAITPS